MKLREARVRNEGWAGIRTTLRTHAAAVDSVEAGGISNSLLVGHYRIQMLVEFGEQTVLPFFGIEPIVVCDRINPILIQDINLIMSILFLAIDGDDVGRQLETYIVANQVENLTSFFQQFQVSMQWLETILIDTYGANILFNGGDNLLATIDQNKFSLSSINKIRSQFLVTAHRTLSIGIGTSPRNAFIALKLAKAGGKDRVEHIENEIL